MSDQWTCSICGKTLRCSCDSENCLLGHDVRDHILTHECQCDPCLDKNCDCQTKRCLVCVTREYKGPII